MRDSPYTPAPDTLAPNTLAAQRLVFWQGYRSIHQAPLLRHVARLWNERTGGTVQLNLAEAVPEYRLASGWQDFDYGDVTVTDNGDRMGSFAQGTFDIFSGFPAQRSLAARVRRMRRNGRRFAVAAERPGDEVAWKNALRRLKYRWVRLQLPDDFLLFTLSADAERFFRRAGFRRAHYRPFGYFPESPFVPAPEGETLAQVGLPRPATERVELLFVGSLDHRKAPDRLLEALGRVGSMPWHLSIIGAGPMRADLERRSAAPDLRGKVTLLGPLTNAQTQRYMQAADHLVLPSRYDGWGAVVNESLLAGTPVLLSNQVGARALLVSDTLGQLLPGTDDAMAAALRRVVAAGPVPAPRKEAIGQWARSEIIPQQAADYLVRSIASYLTEAPPPPDFFASMGVPDSRS